MPGLTCLESLSGVACNAVLFLYKLDSNQFMDAFCLFTYLWTLDLFLLFDYFEDCCPEASCTGLLNTCFLLWGMYLDGDC